jgi:hypothetical protein
VSTSTLALITVPLFTGVIGYTTNWTGVLMLFYPVHFRGWRAPWLQPVARRLAYKVRQIPGLMIGGLGRQGIVPSRAAKMGSLAVDSGIAKLGTPKEFFNQLDPEKIAEQIVLSTRDEIPQIVERVVRRERPELWVDLPDQLKALVSERVQEQLPATVQSLTEEIGEHIDQLVDVKLMVIKRFDPELANRVFLDMGRAEVHPELRLRVRLRARDPGRVPHPLSVVLVALADPRGADRLRDQLGGAVDDLRAARVEEIRSVSLEGPVIRRQPEVAGVYASIVADEILTVAEFGKELLCGPRSDRTRALVESAMLPAVDRATGQLQPAVRVAVGTVSTTRSATRLRPSRSSS